MNRFVLTRFLLALVFVVVTGAQFASTHAQTPPASGSNLDRSIQVDGLERTYHVHLPAMTTPSPGVPLLIMLHGGTGNGSRMEQRSGFSELADREGFIVVYPDGTGLVNGRFTWNAYDCCGYAQRKQVDDVGFISALIDRMIEEFDVDPARVYITGYSNGAMMTFRLACELSDKIAAAAPYAGALNTDSCGATQPVPILIMNGEEDQNVPVAGGLSPNAGAPSQNDRVDQPTSHAVDTWSGIDGCADVPIQPDSEAALISTYGSCLDGAVVEQVLIHDWDHRWPSETNGSLIDASDVIWDFVSRFAKPSSGKLTTVG
jgi:polyhydroxybutyrate depolymerase